MESCNIQGTSSSGDMGGEHSRAEKLQLDEEEEKWEDGIK
jgi:hypothetical protein